MFAAAASIAKTKADGDANEEILKYLSKRGPDALHVLVEALEAEEDVHKMVIERIRKGNTIYFRNEFYTISTTFLEWPEDEKNQSEYTR